MAIIPKQIGWSQESNLLWYILKQLNKLTSIIFNLKPKYKVYTALLTQIGGDDPLNIVDVDTIIGATYEIADVQGSDFTVIGAPNNEIGTKFVATGTSPNWGSSGLLLYNTGAPVVTVLENTIGNVWFELDPDVLTEGYSVAKSDGLFNPGKTVTFFSLTGNGQILISGNKSSDDNNSIHFFAAALPTITAAGIYDQGIEIRVYN